jgi:hypothetical protein
MRHRGAALRSGTGRSGRAGANLYGPSTAPPAPFLRIATIVARCEAKRCVLFHGYGRRYAPLYARVDELLVQCLTEWVIPCQKERHEPSREGREPPSGRLAGRSSWATSLPVSADRSRRERSRNPSEPAAEADDVREAPALDHDHARCPCEILQRALAIKSASARPVGESATLPPVPS